MRKLHHRHVAETSYDFDPSLYRFSERNPVMPTNFEELQQQRKRSEIGDSGAHPPARPTSGIQPRYTSKRSERKHLGSKENSFLTFLSNCRGTFL